MPKTTFALGLTALLLLGLIRTNPPDAVTTPTTVYLVRHAEKVDESRDAELSPAGRARAETLAWVLAHADLDAIYTTPYRRTRGTAQPTAAAHKIAPADYGPRDSLAERLLTKHSGERVLVVGHSNTVPALLRDLGTAFAPQLLDGYDDLFIVQAQRSADGEITGRLMHLQYPQKGPTVAP